MRQSRARSLVRNDATTMRARLCTKPSALQLAHGRVDDGVAGAPLLPRPFGLGIVAPAVTAVHVVGPRGVGTVGEDLRVEVPPAELAHERVGTLALVVRGDAQHLEG